MYLCSDVELIITNDFKIRLKNIENHYLILIVKIIINKYRHF